MNRRLQRFIRPSDRTTMSPGSSAPSSSRARAGLRVVHTNSTSYNRTRTQTPRHSSASGEALPSWKMPLRDCERRGLWSSSLPEPRTSSHALSAGSPIDRLPDEGARLGTGLDSTCPNQPALQSSTPRRFGCLMVEQGDTSVMKSESSHRAFFGAVDSSGRVTSFSPAAIL